VLQFLFSSRAIYISQQGKTFRFSLCVCMYLYIHAWHTCIHICVCVCVSYKEEIEKSTADRLTLSKRCLHDFSWMVLTCNKLSDAYLIITF
jgi:hypothetical protein